MAVQRSTYVPQRFDWWYGESPTQCDVTIREADTTDVAQIRRLIHGAGGRASIKTVQRWLSQNNYTVRLICRNHRHAVALCVARHGPDGNNLLHLVCPADIVEHFPKVAPRLLLLAAAELPEVPCRAVVKLSDADAQALLRSCDWKMVRCDETADEAEFTFGPCVS